MTKYQVTLDDEVIDTVDSYSEACELAEEIDNDPRNYWKNVDIVRVEG